MRKKLIKFILPIIILGATASVCLSHWGTTARGTTIDTELTPHLSTPQTILTSKELPLMSIFG